MNCRPIIGITGGIGSGKSVVSRILRLLGYEVYDCDSEARLIMERSAEIRESLISRFGSEAVNQEGSLNRRHIADRVFGNSEELKWLNSIVHKAVREDVARRAELAMEGDKSLPEGATAPLFVESAILATSGLAGMCREVWLVDAPEEVRLERAMGRDGAPRQEIKRRMEAQKTETDALAAYSVCRIDNSGCRSLLGQIGVLLGDAGKGCD